MYRKVLGFALTLSLITSQLEIRLLLLAKVQSLRFCPCNYCVISIWSCLIFCYGVYSIKLYMFRYYSIYLLNQSVDFQVCLLLVFQRNSFSSERSKSKFRRGRSGKRIGPKMGRSNTRNEVKVSQYARPFNK